MKYFVSQEEISLYNLEQEECEIHTLEDKKTLFIVSADEAKIATWIEANGNRVSEFSAWDGKSVQLDFTKARLVQKLREKTSKAIEALYPLYKQNNINNLQGYTQEDKDAMWEYINNYRDICDQKEAAIAEAISLKELKIIEEEL